MSARRHWAEKAEKLSVSQLDGLRATAERWRNGLAGLTALLAVVTAAKGRENFSELTTTGRVAAAALLSGAFLLLLVGTLVAMYAAFGLPRKHIWLTGPSLEQWERGQMPKVRLAILGSAVLFVAGVVAAATATVIFWINQPASPPAMLVVSEGGDPVCGELVGSDSGKLTIKASDDLGREVERAFPYAGLRGLHIVEECEE